MGNELYYIKDGEKGDSGFHEEILAVGPNLEAARLRVKEAVESGIEESVALDLFGLTDESTSQE